MVINEKNFAISIALFSVSLASEERYVSTRPAADGLIIHLTVILIFY